MKPLTNDFQHIGEIIPHVLKRAARLSKLDPSEPVEKPEVRPNGQPEGETGS